MTLPAYDVLTHTVIIQLFPVYWQNFVILIRLYWSQEQANGVIWDDQWCMYFRKQYSAAEMMYFWRPNPGNKLPL